jgi:hypothetical protein
LAAPTLNIPRPPPSAEEVQAKDSPDEEFIASSPPKDSSDISLAGGIIQEASPPGHTAQANEHSNAGLSFIPLPTVSVGSQQQQRTYVAGSRPVVIIGSKNISRNGPVATINGETVSLGLQALVLGTKTIPIPISIALGTEQVIVMKGSANQNLIVIGSSTVTALDSEYTTAGHKVWFVKYLVIVDDASTYQFTAALETMPAQTNVRIKGEQPSNTADSTPSPTSHPSKGAGDILTFSSPQDVAKTSSESEKKNRATCGYAIEPLLVVTVGIVVLFTILV